jgi:hypothetical protein
MDEKQLFTHIEIPVTEDTPRVYIDTVEKILKIIGPSFPEDVQEFYDPVINWIDEFETSNLKDLTCELEFTVLNSPSNKIVFDFLKKLEKLQYAGKNVHIYWYHDENDEDMQDIGEDFKDTIKVPFDVKIR